MVGKIRTRKGCEYWYDGSCRCWFAYPVNAEGAPDGDSVNAYTRPEIEDAIDDGLTRWDNDTGGNGYGSVRLTITKSKGA